MVSLSGWRDLGSGSRSSCWPFKGYHARDATRVDWAQAFKPGVRLRGQGGLLAQHLCPKACVCIQPLVGLWVVSTSWLLWSVAVIILLMCSVSWVSSASVKEQTLSGDWSKESKDTPGCEDDGGGTGTTWLHGDSAQLGINVVQDTFKLEPPATLFPQRRHLLTRGLCHGSNSA